MFSIYIPLQYSTACTCTTRVLGVAYQLYRVRAEYEVWTDSNGTCWQWEGECLNAILILLFKDNNNLDVVKYNNWLQRNCTVN